MNLTDRLRRNRCRRRLRPLLFLVAAFNLGKSARSSKGNLCFLKCLMFSLDAVLRLRIAYDINSRSTLILVIKEACVRNVVRLLLIVDNRTIDACSCAARRLKVGNLHRITLQLLLNQRLSINVFLPHRQDALNAVRLLHTVSKGLKIRVVINIVLHRRLTHSCRRLRQRLRRLPHSSRAPRRKARPAFCRHCGVTLLLLRAHDSDIVLRQLVLQQLPPFVYRQKQIQARQPASKQNGIRRKLT